MAGGFDGVGTVKGSIRERHVQEITTYSFALIFKTLSGVMDVGTGDLVLVNGYAGDVAAGNGRHRSHRATDTATDVKCAFAGLQSDEGGDAGFVGGLACGPVLFWEEGGEVEGGAPSPFIEIGDEGVEFVDEVGDFFFAIDDCAFAAGEGVVLVVVIFDLERKKGGGEGEWGGVMVMADRGGYFLMPMNECAKRVVCVCTIQHPINHGKESNWYDVPRLELWTCQLHQSRFQMCQASFGIHTWDG